MGAWDMGPLEEKMKGAPNPGKSISTKLQRIAELARTAPDMVFTSLSHHIDIDFLRGAHRRTRKDGAAGVDEQTAAEYAVNLDENLELLLNRFKSGSYKAPPVRRVYIPKANGKKRPIGIPTFEDKILQRAVTMILEAVYEQDFLDCSYAFRPGRSPHQAQRMLRDELMVGGGGYVIAVDIEGFYDNLSHEHLRGFLDQRVCDGVLRRTIHKWLKAGVMESGNVSYPEKGSPQGGVISPILSNVFLHHVLDKWFADEILPRLDGRARLIRYADDVLIVLKNEADTLRVMNVLPKRFGKYGLTLHGEKTHVIDFHRPANRGSRGKGKGPRSFDFLGFTHYWGKTRGGWQAVQVKTAASRLSRSLRKISEWCRKNRHRKVSEQHETLTRKMRGHYNYYGISGNYRALRGYSNGVRRAWQKWLNRRSQQRHMPWPRFERLEKRYRLPRPRIVHSTFVT